MVILQVKEAHSAVISSSSEVREGKSRCKGPMSAETSASHSQPNENPRKKKHKAKFIDANHNPTFRALRDLVIQNITFRRPS